MAEVGNRAKALTPQRRPVPTRRVPISKHAFALFALLSLFASGCLAQEVHPTESQVKAAYLYNFGKFVTWPDDRVNSGLFQICILGRDPFGAVLDATVHGESIGQKKITVRRLSTLQEAASCSILFVSSSDESHLAAIFADARRMHLLTVSDIPGFAERGGNIGFVTYQDRIRFEVNRSTANQNHLALSSELLKVAVKVIGQQDARR